MTDDDIRDDYDVDNAPIVIVAIWLAISVCFFWIPLTVCIIAAIVWAVLT